MRTALLTSYMPDRFVSPLIIFRLSLSTSKSELNLENVSDGSNGVRSIHQSFIVVSVRLKALAGLPLNEGVEALPIPVVVP